MHTGRKSKRIFSSSVALIVRPLAGKPTKKRAVMPFSVISQAVRETFFFALFYDRRKKESYFFGQVIELDIAGKEA